MKDSTENPSRDELARRILYGAAHGDYDVPLAAMRDPWLHEQFSQLRRGLLGWFPLQSTWNILELAAGYGPLTGTLLDSGARVTVQESDRDRAEALRYRYSGADRLRVFEGKLEELKTEECYDLILALQVPPEYYGREQSYFARCASLLKQDGVLLAGFRNRCGLRYWCGATDERVKIPFEGLAEPGRADGLYTPAAFARLLKESGFARHRYYIPLPDALFPQMILAEEAFPAEGIGERVMACLAGGPGAVLDPNPLLEKLDRERLLPQMADDYLGVFQKAEQTPLRLPDTVYLSADRGRENSFAVMMFPDGEAVKTPLWPEGEPAARAQTKNLETLKARGLKVLETRFENGRILMRREHAPTLMEKLRTVREPGELTALFDRLREDALRASNPAAPQADDETWGVPEEQLGPILETGYPDMTPFNIFCRGEDFCYFDQEFTLAHCPLGYVLFRALYYAYRHVPTLEAILPQEELKRRYGLTEHWALFQRREESFLRALRRTELYKPFYEWGRSDLRGMERRREKLLEDREATVLRAVHRIQLGLLKELDGVCRTLGLHYYAIHGTLLGAVRHGGFIPWDDDVDLAMDRKDYEILLSKGAAMFSRDCFLQTEDSDRACYFGGYARLRHERSSAMEYPAMLHRCHQGVWIDIFPLDGCEEKDDRRQRRQTEITRLQRILYAKYYPAGSGMLAGLSCREMGRLGRLAEAIPGRLLRLRLNRLYRACADSPKKAILCCIYGEAPNRNVFDGADMTGEQTLPFEDMLIPVPKNPEAILTARYGPHFDRLPPPEKRRSRHLVWLDPWTPWERQDQEQILAALRDRSQLELTSSASPALNWKEGAPTGL